MTPTDPLTKTLRRTMSDTTGHFRIGDLNFSFDGEIEELAEIQQLMREFRRAERRLRQASGADKVFVVFDKDLPGEQGTFDKIRLRAYDDRRNYDLDVGHTDTNPLGIYVGYDQNIRVWDRGTEESWEIDSETGNRVENGSSRSERRRETDERSRQGPPPSREGNASLDGEEIPETEELQLRQTDARVLRSAAQMDDDYMIGQEKAVTIWNAMKRCGLGSKAELQKLCDYFDVERLDELPAGKVKRAYQRIDEMLVFMDDDLPY